MGSVEGSRAVEVDAPLERCFAIISDIERTPEWQGSLTAVEVLERDGEGRPALARTEWDARVRSVAAELRFSYEPAHRVAWRQERGELRSLSGSWTLERLGDARTRATYELAADPGTMLGLLLRGGVEATVRDHLLSGATEGLRRRAASAS